MAIINKIDTTGNKGLLAKAEFGYDDYKNGGDEGRIYIGTGTKNIAIAKKEEINEVKDKINTHIINKITETEERISKYFIEYINKYPNNDKYKQLIFNECNTIINEIDINIDNLI